MTLLHDGDLTISVGKSRAETRWKQQTLKWSDLCQKLLTTTRTEETFEQYLKYDKPKQDQIKDVGAFVGGVIQGGRRKKNAVLSRSLITLDADFAVNGILDDLEMLGYGACYYSTHKHTPDKKRLRLVIPMTREVFSDEYQAIARRVADMLGIEQFDPTTFQPERLMYWPSTAKDGEFVSSVIDSEWLNPDDVLNMYHNWRDITQWPGLDDAKVRRDMKKQGDPLSKPGVVGAFCKAYPISEAITTFLSDVYDVCDVKDRYTYKLGSTAAGVIVYDDVFAYSHHATDPTSMKLCNAFDLVRLHLYGHLDEGSEEGTPTVSLPSYKEMVEVATKDPQVKQKLGELKLREAKDEFKDVKDEDIEWVKQLEVDKKGNFYSTIENMVIILRNDPNLRGCFGFDEFSDRYVLLRDTPWAEKGKLYVDVDDSHVRHYFEKVYSITGTNKILDAMGIIFKENSFHPIKRWLESLTWDGKERLDAVLVDYLGAEDSSYVRETARKLLVAAISRIYAPGTKFDTAIILVGDQGIGKSTLIKKLGKEWASESFGSIEHNKAVEQLKGAWIIEIGELAGLRKAELDEIKHFMSKTCDSYRPAYGRRVEEHPRKCVFIGTTNEYDPLKDQTGNRRFWPIECRSEYALMSVFDDLDGEIDQIWAEAMIKYQAGESLILSRDADKLAKIKQREHTQEYHYATTILNYLDRLFPDNWELMNLLERKAYLDPYSDDEFLPIGTVKKQETFAFEIWMEAIGGSRKDFNKMVAHDINQFLRSLKGWKYAAERKRFNQYGQQRYFQRVTR